MKTIEPRLLKGFRDYLPNEQVARAKMLETIKKVFERFGFEPLETPVLEYEEILNGKYGEEGEKLMYRFKDQGERDVAMRYDLTVPLARVTAQYGAALPKPFKRYQVASVWRAENTQKGRYREFLQCDADIVGAEVGVPDAELIAMAEQIYSELGFKKFVVKVNNRKILNAIMQTAGLPADKVIVGIRAIDKMEKIGAKAVAEELEEKLGMKKNEAEGLIRLASTKVPDVGALKTFINKHVLKNPQGQQGFEELNRVFTALHEFGLKNVEIDLALARGLDYYTSTIFEVVITENVETRRFGSVGGGGRFDTLVKLFTGKEVPAVGFSVGVDRLFALMQETKKVQASGVVQVLVLNLDAKYEPRYIKVMSELREAGISTEMYYQEGDLKKQFNYAEKKKIPFAVIVGENEIKKKEVTIRNLLNRKQTAVPQKNLVKEVLRLLKD